MFYDAYYITPVQNNKQAELALKLYNLNLAAINTELQEQPSSKHKIRCNSSAKLS